MQFRERLQRRQILRVTSRRCRFCTATRYGKVRCKQQPLQRDKQTSDAAWNLDSRVLPALCTQRQHTATKQRQQQQRRQRRRSSSRILNLRRHYSVITGDRPARATDDRGLQGRSSNSTVGRSATVNKSRGWTDHIKPTYQLLTCDSVSPVCSASSFFCSSDGYGCCNNRRHVCVRRIFSNRFIRFTASR